MSNGAFIGRVGALAVALGVGAAVTAWPGLALAETSGDGSTSSSGGSSPSAPSPSGASPSGSAAAPTGPAASAPSAGLETQSPDATQLPSTAPSTGAPSEESIDPRSGVVQSSGGAHTGTFGTDANRGADAKGDSDSSDEPPSPVPPKVLQSDDGTVVTESQDRGTAGRHRTDAPDPVAARTSPATQAPTENTRPTAPIAAAQEPSVDDDARATIQPRRVTVAATTSAPAATAIPTVETPPPPVMTAAPMALRGSEPDLVDLVLNPYLTDDPDGAPADSPLMWSMLAWTRRQAAPASALESSSDGASSMAQRSVVVTATVTGNPPLNTAPVAAAPSVGAPDPATGAVTGSLNFTDPDGDTLAYTVTTNPAKGALVIRPDGTFTYTPTTAARLRAYASSGDDSDAFTVTASDGEATATTSVTPTVDPARFEATATVDVEYQPREIVFSPDGTRAYVLNGGFSPTNFSGVVSVIDTNTLGVIATIPIGGYVDGIAVNPDGTRALVTVTSQSAVPSVSVIDTTSNQVVSTIALGGIGTPQGVAYSPDGMTAYVTDSNRDEVFVIDTITNAVTGSFQVEDQPIDVAFSPDGTRAYVANWGSGTVSVIDTGTESIIGTITTGPGPGHLVISADGTRGYVSNFFNQPVFTSFDTATNIATNVSLGTNGNPRDVALTPDGSVVFVSETPGLQIAVVDTATNTLLTTLAPGYYPEGIAVSPDGTRLLAANIVDGTVSVFTLMHAVNHAPVAGTPTVGAANPLTGVVTGSLNVTDPDGDAISYTVANSPTNGTIVVRPDGTFTYTPTEAARLNAGITAGADVDGFTIAASDGLVATNTSVTPPIDAARLVLGDTISFNHESGPVSVVYSLDGTQAYIPLHFDGGIAVVNTADSTVVTTIPLQTYPQALAISPDGTRLYATAAGGNISQGVLVIDIATNTVVATIPTVEYPLNIAVSPDGTRAYITNDLSNTVTVLNTVDNTVVTTITGFHVPLHVAVSPDGTRVYVTNTSNGPGEISVVDTSDNTVIATIRGGQPGSGSQPSGLALSPDGSQLYFADAGLNNVTVVNTGDNAIVRTITGVTNPISVSVSPDGSLLYVASQATDTVSVIDVTSGNILASFAFGDHPNGVVAVNPDGTSAYVVRSNADAISKIVLQHANSAPVAGATTLGAPDAVTGAVSGSVVFTDPDGDALTYSVTTAPTKGTLVVRPDGTFAYTPTGRARLDAYATPESDVDSFLITAADGLGGSTSVAVDAVPVSPTEAAVTAALNISSAHGVVISPDSTRAYVARLEGTVSVVDTSTGAVIATIAVGGLPRFAAITPDGAHVYVANQYPGNVAVIDTATNTITATINVGEGAYDVAINRDGSRAYVTNVNTGTLSVIDTASNTVTATINVSPDVRQVALSPDGSRAYVTDPRTGVVVVDTATNTVIETISDGAAQDVVFSPDGSQAYTTRFNNFVTVIDTSTSAVISYIDVGQAPAGIAISRDGTRVYATTIGDSTVKVIDTATNTVIGTVSVGNFPIDIALSPNGAFAYVTNVGSGTVSVITFVTAPAANGAPTLTVTQVGGIDPTTGAITFQANASDPDGDPLIYGASAGTAKGFVTPNADGTYTYVPSDYARHNASAETATAADKTDSFFITVTDPSGASATVRTAVVITPKNAAPSGGMTSSTVDSSTGVVIGTFALGDEDGDVLSYTGTADTAKGHLTVNPDGTFVFTPTDAARHAASSDTAGPTDHMDVVSFVANDGHGGIVGAQMNVPLIPKNSAPTAGTTTSVFNGTTGATAGSIGAIDADADTLNYRLIGNAAKGTVTVNSDGTYTYTTTAANRHVAAADTATAAQRQDTFTVSVDDAHGGVSPLTITTQVNTLNNAPTVTLTQSGNPNATTGAITYAVTARDADGDPLTYTVTASPAKGAVVRNANGTYTYTPTAAARHDAALSTATTTQKQDAFTVTVSDAHGGATSATATPTIGGKNAAPTVTLAQIGTADTATGAVTYQINGSDPDGDALSYTVSTSPAKGVAVVNTNGTLTYTPTDAARHLASATTATTAQKQDTFTVTANDAHGASAVTTTRVTISPRNAAPAVTLSQVEAVNASTGAIIFAANGIDPDGDALTYTVTANPTRGTVVRNTDGTYTYTPSTTARHAASADTAIAAQLQDSFTVTANDAHGRTTAASAAPAISPENTAPTVALTQVGSANATTGAVTYRTTVNDPDGDTLSYAITVDPTKGSVVRNTNGTYTYTPTAAARHAAAADAATADQKLDAFGITANDAHGASTMATTSPTISPKNTGPSTTPAVGAPDAGGTVTGTVGGSDADGDNLTYSVTTGPAKGTVTVNPDGTFTYDPSAVARHAASADNATAAQKRDTFTVGVTDGYGGTRTVTITTQISPKNAGPRATPTATNTNLTTGSVSGAVAGSDQDGDSLVYAVTSRPSKGTLTVNPDGTLTYTPTAAARTTASRPNATAAQRQDSFAVSVKDGHGGTTIVTYTVPLSLTSSGSVVILVNPASSLAP